MVSLDIASHSYLFARLVNTDIRHPTFENIIKTINAGHHIGSGIDQLSKYALPLQNDPLWGFSWKKNLRQS
jgi:hypothetical protein